MNIALLEDNPPILDYLSTALELHGHTVHKFTDSAPLLETIPTGKNAQVAPPYDLAIIDLLLPGPVSGIETIQKIWQALAPYRLPMIVVTACGQKELEAARAILPQVPFLRKPFKMRELLQLINQLQPAR